MPRRPHSMDYGVRPAPAHALREGAKARLTTNARRIKRNRKRRDWNKPIRQICAVIACVEILVFLLAYPGFRVRNVRIEGLRTLTAGRAFGAAHVPEKTNIFMMAMFHPLARNLERLPVVEHASRVVDLPNTIVLRVVERQPYAVLQSAGSFYLIDKMRVPYAPVDGPVRGLPTIKATDLAAADPVKLGIPISSDWLIQAYNLLSLLSDKESLKPKLITVDQNANLCLNRQDNLRINIGTPDDLPAKVWSADVIARAIGPGAATRAEYVDVSCPTHTALMVRHGKAETGHARRGEGA